MHQNWSENVYLSLRGGTTFRRKARMMYVFTNCNYGQPSWAPCRAKETYGNWISPRDLLSQFRIKDFEYMHKQYFWNRSLSCLSCFIQQFVSTRFPCHSECGRSNSSVFLADTTVAHHDFLCLFTCPSRGGGTPSIIVFFVDMSDRWCSIPFHDCS